MNVMAQIVVNNTVGRAADERTVQKGLEPIVLGLGKWDFIELGIRIAFVGLTFPVTIVPSILMTNNRWHGIDSYVNGNLLVWLKRHALATFLLLGSKQVFDHTTNLVPTVHRLLGASYTTLDEAATSEEGDPKKEKKKRELSVVAALGVTTLCSLGVMLLWAPLDAALVLTATEPGRFASITECLRFMWKEGGLFGLYRGLLPLTLYHTSWGEVFRILYVAYGKKTL